MTLKDALVDIWGHLDMLLALIVLNIKEYLVFSPSPTTGILEICPAPERDEVAKWSY